MANILKQLQKILTARFGEEVRGSIHDALHSINEQVENSETSAGNSATLAEGYAKEAKQSAEEISKQAVEARSYAVGGTGTRQGEDSDNAKYYCRQAEDVLQKVQTPINEETPTYEVPEELAELESGERLHIAFGKISLAVRTLIGFFRGDGMEDAFYSVFTKAGDATSMSLADIEEAITTEWNGESSGDVQALTAEKIEEAIATKWNGESSTDSNALTAEDIEDAIK